MIDDEVLICNTFAHEVDIVKFENGSCSRKIPNPKFSKDLWLCDICRRAIDTQLHVMICPAYKKLREGKDAGNDEDLVEYLVEVMKIRERMGFRK